MIDLADVTTFAAILNDRTDGGKTITVRDVIDIISILAVGAAEDGGATPQAFQTAWDRGIRVSRASPLGPT